MIVSLMGDVRNNVDPFMREIMQLNGVKEITSSFYLPNRMRTGNNAIWEETDESAKFMMRGNGIDFNFIDFYDLKIVKGRKFLESISGDLSDGIIVNETAAKYAPWDNPVGKRVKINDTDYTVVGIVKDFHFKPLSSKIEPSGMRLFPAADIFSRPNVVSVKVNTDKIRNIISGVEKIWRTFSPDLPYRYSFLDENVYNMYKAENRLGQSFLYLTIIAVIITILGLFGLVSFIIEQKTKEMGIRKVLGATGGSVVWHISKDFLLLIMLANVVSWPAAYYMMNHWLRQFIYRIDIGILIFIISFFINIIITLAAIGYQTVKIANINPVNSLRCD